MLFNKTRGCSSEITTSRSNLTILAYIAFTCFLFLSQQVNASTKSNEFSVDPTWLKLLHFDSTGSNHTSRVSSNEFFLTDNGRNDAISEFIAFKDILQSHNTEVACQYPARYTWFTQHVPGTPRLDLEKCPELVQFLQSFQTKHLSIVFASEFLFEPSSSFGHIMLVFHDKPKPDLLSDAIYFSAVSNLRKDGFAMYAINGLSGEYPAYFYRSAFLKKIYEYTILQQRYLYSFPVSITKKQTLLLLYHLFELRKAKFKYFFSKENCAYQIAALLDVALGEDSFDSAYYVLPIEVLNKFANVENSNAVYLPSIVHSNLLYSKMSEADKTVFLNTIDNVTPPDRVSNKTVSNIVAEALQHYYTYLFRRLNRAPSNYAQIMSLNYQKSTYQPEFVPKLERTGGIKLGLGFADHADNHYLAISFRPMLRDLTDVQWNPQQEMELNVFQSKLLLRQDEVQLRQLDLVSIKSLAKRNRLFRPASWAFYLGANRENQIQRLNTELSADAGHSYAYRKASVSLMFGLGYRHSFEHWFVRPSLLAQVYLAPKVKLSARRYMRYARHNRFQFSSLSMSKRFSNSLLGMQYYRQDAAGYGVQHAGSSGYSIQYQYYF